MSGRNKWQSECFGGGRRWRPQPGRKNWAGALTQVPSHQIGIVEILHAQAHDMDEFLYDLHELHRSGIDLDRIRQEGWREREREMTLWKPQMQLNKL